MRQQPRVALQHAQPLQVSASLLRFPWTYYVYACRRSMSSKNLKHSSPSRRV